MPRVPILSGYRRVPGKARRYLTPSGDVISRYEYDSRRAQQVGFSNRGELERARRSKEWRHWSFKIASERESNLGTRGFHAPRIADWQLVHDAQAVADARAGLGEPGELEDPDGALSRLLIAIGARDENWNWPVGETPSGVKA